MQQQGQNSADAFACVPQACRLQRSHTDYVAQGLAQEAGATFRSCSRRKGGAYESQIYKCLQELLRSSEPGSPVGEQSGKQQLNDLDSDSQQQPLAQLGRRAAIFACASVSKSPAERSSTESNLTAAAAAVLT